MKPAPLIAFLLCCLLFAGASAATLLGIVTERAAPTAVEAAHRHLANHPRDRILLRTPAQLMAASERDLAQWFGQADSVLAVAVFGDPARHCGKSHERTEKPS